MNNEDKFGRWLSIFFGGTKDILTLILGDPKSRVPKFLMAAGLAGMLSQWWVPFILAIAEKYLELDMARIDTAENGSFGVGLAVFITGLFFWLLMNQSSLAIRSDSAERENHPGTLQLVGWKLMLAKLVVWLGPSGTGSSHILVARSRLHFEFSAIEQDSQSVVGEVAEAASC